MFSSVYVFVVLNFELIKIYIKTYFVVREKLDGRKYWHFHLILSDVDKNVKTVVVPLNLISLHVKALHALLPITKN